MNKKAIFIIVIIIILGGIVGVLFMKNPAKAPSETTDTSSTTTSSENKTSTESDVSPVATTTVDIKDFAFTPVAITVKKGATVTWTNQDSTRHSISPDTESTDFKASQLLSQGETYKVTFNTVGTYTYHCTPHPYMKASVIVTE